MSEGTRRTVESRLFPAWETDMGWSLSAQADRAGYACSPRERLDRLEDYRTVEVAIFKEGLRVVDPAGLDLPAGILAKFEPPGAGGPAIGAHLTGEEVAEVRQALLRAGMSPNAGVPRGSLGWEGATLWHGTDRDSAEDISANGIRMEASSRGYFGPAFYAADDRSLAVSNYADAFDEEPGAVIRIEFNEGARILDLRNPSDAEEWAPWSGRVSDPGFDRLMRRAGIDAVYDRSMGGLAIYRADAVTVLGIENLEPERGEDPAP